MPRDCPSCCRALEELVQELRKVATKGHLVSNVAAKMV
jgi:hypothetical protein